jgi:hypothetical protein
MTFPCVVGHRIVELTAEQRDAIEWRQKTPDEKLAILLGRIEALEAEVKRLKEHSLSASGHRLCPYCSRPAESWSDLDLMNGFRWEDDVKVYHCMHASVSD